MEFKIVGHSLPSIIIDLHRGGEEVYTQAGGMSWMTDNIKICTNTQDCFTGKHLI